MQNNSVLAFTGVSIPNGVAYLDYILGAALSKFGRFDLVTTDQPGTDALAAGFAEHEGLRCLRFQLDADIYGRSSWDRLVDLLATHCTVCIVVWDGTSAPIKNLIARTVEKGVPTYVFYPGREPYEAKET